MKRKSPLSLSKVTGTRWTLTEVNVDKGDCQSSTETHKSYMGFPVVETWDILTI